MIIQKIRHILNRGIIDKEDINAVHDDDLEDFLGNIGLIRDIKSGSKQCKFCDKTINLDNIQAVFPDSGTINVVCNKRECIKDFLDYSERIK